MFQNHRQYRESNPRFPATRVSLRSICSRLPYSCRTTPIHPSKNVLFPMDRQQCAPGTKLKHNPHLTAPDSEWPLADHSEYALPFAIADWYQTRQPSRHRGQRDPSSGPVVGRFRLALSMNSTVPFPLSLVRQQQGYRFGTAPEHAAPAELASSRL